MSDPNRVGEDLPNWSPRQPERIDDLKRSRERRPGRFAPWERDIAFLIEFYEAALDPPAVLIAVVRRGVESGTIKGAVVEACVVAWPPGHDTGITPLVVDRPGIYIVVGPVSDGGEDA